MSTNRTRGTMVTLIPATSFAALEQSGVKIEETYLIDRGEGEGPRYATINTEGVTHAPTDGLFHVLNDWRDAAYAVSVERIVEESQGGEQHDLADVVRVFGSRLESNFYQAHCWANRA